MVRFLITFGLAMIIIGFCYSNLQELGLVEIPGDLCFKRGNLQIYFPITTSILTSGLINLIMWFYNKN